MQQGSFSVEAGVDAQAEGRQLGRPEREPGVRAVVAELGDGLGEGGYDRLLHEHNLRKEGKKNPQEEIEKKTTQETTSMARDKIFRKERLTRDRDRNERSESRDKHRRDGRRENAERIQNV